MEWLGEFWKEHGDWVVLMIWTLGLAVGAIFSGIEQIADSGQVVIIGILMYCFNRLKDKNGK